MYIIELNNTEVKLKMKSELDFILEYVNSKTYNIIKVLSQSLIMQDDSRFYKTHPSAGAINYMPKKKAKIDVRT